MIVPIGAFRAEQVVMASPAVRAIVSDGLRDIKPEHHGVCTTIAGQMLSDGIIAAYSSDLSLNTRQLAKEIVAEYQQAGIIPFSPWFTIGWWVIKLVIIPWVEYLLRQYATYEKPWLVCR